MSVLCIVMYFYKADFEKINQASYYDLYDYSANALFEKYQIEVPNTIHIQLKNKMGAGYSWQVKIGDSIIQTCSGDMPFIKAITGIHHYDIYDATGKLFTSLQAEYFPQEEQRGLLGFGKVFIYEGNLSLNKEINNLNNWKNTGLQITEKEKQQVRQLLQYEVKISSSDSTQNKVKKMASFICRNTLASAGSPTDSINKLPVMEQFAAAKMGYPVWCGHYTNFLRAFLNEAGIINRYIEIKQTYGVDGSVHIFNEYFIPEQNKWALADISFGNWGYTDATGRLMNAVDIKNSSRFDTTIKALHYKDDGFKEVPYSNMNTDFFINYGRDKELYFYYNTNMEVVYRFSEKIKRFITGDSFNVVYSDTRIYSPAMHYVKLAVLLLTAVVFVLVLVLLTGHRFSFR